MKRLLSVIILVISLLGCGREEGLDRAMWLRSALLQGAGCAFQTEITADYGQQQYTFSMDCKADANGNLEFLVLKPETIVGITGRIDDVGGNLTFEDQVLAFPLLTDGWLSPVSAPWIFLHTLRCGYISACDGGADTMKMIIQDNYQQLPVDVEIYCNNDNMPFFVEILCDGRRILTLEINDFEIL